MVQAAYDYNATATLRADEFVAFVEATRIADPIPADVRVMTIHQAKGLGFPVVLLPDAARLFLRASCGEKMREKLNVSTANGQTVKLELSLAPVQSGQNTTGVAGSILQI